MVTMTMSLVRHEARAVDVDGPAGNERLTAWAGSGLLVLLAIEGLTLVLGVRGLLSVHVFVGLMIIGPLLLKLASTGYRFLRYYTRNAAYRLAGPPRPLLRILAPFLILATVALIGSGVALLLVPAGLRQPVLFLHKAGFAGWFLLAAVHVLAYLPRLPRLLGRELAGVRLPRLRRDVATRVAALTGSIAVGLVLAGLLVQRAQPWAHLILEHRHHH